MDQPRDHLWCWITWPWIFENIRDRWQCYSEPNSDLLHTCHSIWKQINAEIYANIILTQPSRILHFCIHGNDFWWSIVVIGLKRTRLIRISQVFLLDKTFFNSYVSFCTFVNEFSTGNETKFSKFSCSVTNFEAQRPQVSVVILYLESWTKPSKKCRNC